MNNFTFHIPTVIHFGKGQIKALADELKTRCVKKLLIVTGRGSAKRSGVFDDVVRQVRKAGISFVELSGVMPNPRLTSVYEGSELCRKEHVDFVLAVGGGSVIDASKTIAAGARYNGDVWDLFTKGATCRSALPVGTVLTLAATGSEMNSYAVITREETQEKLPFGSPFVKPVFSILDPEYTYTVPKYHTAAGVADIMTHIFEEYFAPPGSAGVQDSIAEALLKVCIHYGPIVCDTPADYKARANILWAGSLALNGLLGSGKNGDWACHYIEHEVSALYDISHGAGLAIIVPNWMRYVLSKETEEKLAAYGTNVWGMKEKKKRKCAEGAIEKTRSFFTSLGLPATLSDARVTGERFKEMAKKANEFHGGIGTFKKLSENDIVAILTASL
jgi:alcohol dehydrogenase YqhD (iron-dependent ADH family)